jgi:O-antigen/teichoic acid export membrane protein
MSLKGWSIFAPVVGWNMLAQILQSVNWQLEKLLLPRFMDLVSFGQYSVSSDITAVPFQAVVQPLYRPFYVAFLKVPNRAELGDLFLRSTWTLVFFVAPVLVLLSIMSNVIVHVLLGPSWHNAAFILSILPLIAIGMLPTALVSSICFVADTLHLITIKSVIELVCKVILICVLGYFYGLYGILIGQAVSSIISLGISMVIVRTSIGLSLRRQLTQAFRYLLPIFMMGLCAFSEINFRGESTDFMRQMWFAIAMAALSLLVYIGSVCVVGRLSAPATSHEYEFLVRLLKKRLRPAT